MMATQLERPTFFDLFKSHCSSDLGTISLNWFEELSAEALPYESKEYEEHELGSDWLGENVIQTPKQKPATYSQLESTPVIFKEQVFSSPLFRSPKAKQEKSHVADKNNCEKASASQSIPQHEITEALSPSSRYLNESPALMKEIFKTPLRDRKYLHGTPQRDGKADICTSLFCTPKLMRNQSPKCISESLGAEVDPEMSWSSSLATPPSPTVIIARAHEQSFHPKALEQRNAVIVQSLFSKRSNVTEKCILAPLPVLNENDATTFVDSEVKPDVSLSKRNVSAEASSSTIRAPWKQAISSAIKDDSICQTVENVLDGMEDVLSIFFTSEKNTGLRKVKADHRIRRKNSINSETKNNKSLLKGNGQENPLNALNEHLECVNHIPSINCSKGRSKEDLEEKIQSRETYEWSQLNLCDFTGSPLETVALDASDDGLSNWCKYSQEHKNKLESQNVERVAVNTENNASVVDCNLASEKTLTVVEESDVPIVDHCTACQRKDTETLQRMNTAGKHRTVTNNMPASVDKPVAGLRNTPQGAHGKNNTLFSAMKKQSRFVYSINRVLNDQDWRNKEDITRVSSSDHLCISDGQTKEYDGEQMDLYTVERSQEKVVLKGNKIGEALSFYEREEIVLCTENEEINPSELYKVSSSIKRKVQATASLLARKRLKVETLGKQELKTYPEMQKYIPQTSEALHVDVSTLNQTEGHVASPKMALSTCNVNQIHIDEGKPKKLSCSLASPQHVQLDQPAHVVALPESSEKRTICSGNSRNKYEEPCLGDIDDILKVVTIKQDTGEAALRATECSGHQNLLDFTDLQHPSLCERKSTIPNHKMNAIRGPVHLPDTQRKTFNDFKTALNKNIQISEENMKKGQTLFMGLESQGLRGCFGDKNEEEKCSLETLSSADGPISKGNAKGFRTASNKQINISASTFAKGRLLFKDIEDAKSEVLWSAKERTVDPKPSSYILVDKTGTAHKEKPDASENIDNILLKKQKVPLNVDHKEEGGGINMLTINKQSPVENVPTNENTEPHHIKSIQSLTIPRKDTLYLPFSAEVKRISTQESSTKILSHLNEGLTESQKVEVSELSAILENAGSQLEFTQFRKASAGGINTECRQNSNQGESQSLNNSDVWKDVDFNDSFAAGEDKSENIDTCLSSTEIAQAANERHSEGTLDTASFSKLIKSSLMPSDVHSFQKLEKKTLGGFSFASGKPVNIADEVLVKAKELFNNLEDSDELFKCFVNDSRHSNCCSESTPKDLIKGKCETMATGFAKCHPESVLDCNNCTFSVSSVLGSNVALDCNVDERNHKDTLSKNHCITVNDRSFSAGCNVLKKISPFHNDLGINKNCEEKLTSHSEPVDNDKKELSNQNSSRVLVMKGFQTARGKDIMFSPSSLEKVRNIFADDCPESISLLCNTSNQTHVAQSCRNMEKGVLAHKPAILARPQKPLPCNSNCEDFKLGFSTASGKNVIISDDSLAKVRHLFDEEGKCSENEGAGLKHFDKQGRKTEDAFPGKRQILGEETRNHKSAVAAEENVSSLGSDHEGDICNKIGDHFTSTHKAEKLEEWAFNQNVVINSAECASTLSFGFTTGKGKKISVGEESLLKAKNIFNDLNDVSYNTLLLNGTQCPHVKETITPTSENRIESSTNAIIKQYTEKINNTESKVITSYGISTCAAAFSTASGKSVAVSHDSLQKARQMFSESSHDDHPLDSETEVERRQNTFVANYPRKEQGNECITVSNTSEQLSSIRPPSSFATASNKEVNTDKTSLKKMEMECSGSKDIVTIPPLVEKPFQADIVKEVFFQEQNVCLPEAVSFSTASGKSVQWSEEALKKAREMFSEIDISHFPVPQTQDSIFHAKPKAALNEEEVKIVQNEAHISKKKPLLNTSTNSNCFGFSTASGKHVSVSETALEKAKGMLQDIGDVTEDDPLFKKQFPAEIAGSSSMLNTTKGKDSLDNKFICFQNNTKIKFKGDYKNRLAQTHCPDNPSCPSPLPVSGRDSTPTVKEMTGLSNKSKTNVFFTTHTPENYFEIEAAESAKAFMYDGELTDAGLLTDNAHSSSNTMNKRLGKRLRTEEETLRGEPLIKRQLLPEFDRATDNRPNLLLKPLTSTPEGTLKDRRTFLHNVTLKPVTCEPASFLTGRKDSHIPKFTARNQCHPNSNIFQHISVLKSDDVLSPPVDHISSSCTPSAENTNNLPITKRAVRTFIPPFKKKPGPSADLKGNTPRSDGDGQAGNITEDPKEENEVKLIPLILEDRPDESDLLEIISNLQCGRDMQEMRIRKKQRQKIKPQPGSLYLVKNSSAARIPLQAAVQGKRPSVYSEKKLHMYGVVKNHFGVGSENAASFQFDCMDYFTKDHLMSGNGVQLADGGWLIPTDKGKAGKEEIYRALCDTPGVDPKLISQEWVYNHYRWIVWKLAALEVTFPEIFACRCLTPERVLLQLKYRYDVEIDKSQRSAIKRIMERDDSPAKTLVLCISKIISAGSGLPNSCNNKNESGDSKQSTAVIEVTDGWYSIKALLDPALTNLLRRGRLFIGQKIIVHGAELTGSDDACTPLEAPDTIMLKIAANSTRPACWYTRLGYFRDPRPFRLPLSSLFSEGGIVGCVDVVIQRIYPIQWMEKMANGLYVFRNDRAEEREAEKYTAKQQKNLEVLFTKIQSEFEQREACSKKKGLKRRSLNDHQICALQDGAELYEALQNESDPGYLESCLSSEQLRALQCHRQHLNDKKQAEIQAEFRKAIESSEQGPNSCIKRDVTAVWKMRIVDHRDQDTDTAYILNIWRPLPDVLSLLKEGIRFKIYHLAASQSKSKSEVSEIHFTATKKTRFQQLQPSQKILEKIYSPREVIQLSRFLDPFFRALYAEVDVVGLVISTYRKAGAAPVVYLSDDSYNLIAVKFWTDLGQLALEDVTKPCTFIAASNLRWRAEGRSEIPTIYAGDFSFISSNPKECHLLKALQELKHSIQCVQDLCNEAAAKLRNLLQVTNPEERRSPADRNLEPHTPMSKPGIAGERSATPLALDEKKQNNLAYSPEPSSGAEIELKTCKKRKGLDFLCRIPSPPPVTPVRAFVSPALQKAFRPPRSNNVQKDGTGTKGKSGDLHSAQSHRTSTKVADAGGEFVADEELAMINTQALTLGVTEQKGKTMQESTVVVLKGAESDLPALVSEARTSLQCNKMATANQTQSTDKNPQVYQRKLQRRTRK